MITFINYLIEVNLGLMFFYLIYLLLLQNENQFGFKRIYLIGSLCASLLFPAFTIESQSLVLIPSLSESVPSHWLPAITIYGDGQPAPEQINASISYWTWITYAYVTIVAIIFTIFILRLVAISKLYITARRYAWKNYTVAESTNVKGIFSFFQFIFLSPAENLDEQEKLEILQHEEVHIQKLHSIDILLVNVVGIVCWFNPIIRNYKKSLVQIHEFEADARSVEGRDVDEYCGLLAKVALQTNGYVLANHFTNSFTLKRINMMKTVRKKIKQWKVVTVSFTALIIFFVVACQDQIVSELNASTLSQVSEYPAEVKAELTKLDKSYPGTKFTYLEGSTEEVKKIFADHQQDQKNMVMRSFDFPDRKMTGVITVDLSKYDLKDGDGVYSIVSESAQPKGGMTEYYKYVGAKIKYPEQARKMGVEGRVFVEFIVNTDGSISDTKILKGIGAGCDKEAENVVASSDPWIPAKEKGKVVKQRMVIPIIFQLGNSTKKVELGQAPKNTMEEMVVVGHDKKND